MTGFPREADPALPQRVARTWRGPRRAITVPASVGTLALCAACAAHSPVALPPPSASPRQVVTRYLHALQSGDCDTAHALATSTFVPGNGELCGDVDVKTFKVAADTASTGLGQITFATQMVTNGSGDGSIPPGELTWFYTVKRQSDGSWRLVSGGSGP